MIFGRKLFFHSRSGTPALHLREFYFEKAISWEFLELFSPQLIWEHLWMEVMMHGWMFLIVDINFVFDRNA